MARWNFPIPFVTSGVVAAAITLWMLILSGSTSLPPRPAGPAHRQVPFVDFHQDVPHEEDLLGPSLAAAVRWLLRHQDPEGCWRSAFFTQACEKRVCPGRGIEAHDLGVTALATLSLLESGQAAEQETPLRRALAWLAARQGNSGVFGTRGGKSAYGQALATLAFARAGVLLKDASFRPVAERGIRALRDAQNPGYAWRYGRQDGQNDTSVSFWSGAALLAGTELGLRMENAAASFEGLRRWLAEVTGDRGEVSYMLGGAASSSVRGAGERLERNEGLTASALWLRLRLGEDRGRDPQTMAARRLLWNLPVWTNQDRSMDYLAWYAGTLALADWGDREPWVIWRDRVLRVLALHQRRYHEGCLGGSWDPDDRWGYEGGRVYSTSVNLLTLGVLRRTRLGDRPPAPR